jgi:tetratricopeptide (TPR) repeat protein
MRRDFPLIIVLACCLGAAAFCGRWLDRNRSETRTESAEEQLYINGGTAKRLALSFNGLAADWYWMRSLQYVGRKVVAFEDTHDGNFGLDDLSKIDLHLLPSLLRVTTTLDPQFIRAYEYGAVILPEVNPDEAIALLKEGIAANPSSWRLYQHLGYIYWQRQDYERAGAMYSTGGGLPGAPGWMSVMSARMKAEGGSSNAAREMYQRLYESSDDERVRQMVVAQLMRMQWLEDRSEIQNVLDRFQSSNREGRCGSSWQPVADQFREPRWHIDRETGAPLDPSGVPYRLINCKVDLDPNSKVPR